MRRLEGLLREWGVFHVEHMDWADEYGENILHEAALLEGRVQDVSFGSKVLCPDMHSSLRKIERAVLGLPNWQEKCVRAWYCAPVREDGKLYTKRQLARLLGLSKYKFDEYLRGGKKKLSRVLTG